MHSTVRRWCARNGVGSRVRISGKFGPRPRTEVPLSTLSPLARPGKAIAPEAHIELWSAIKPPSCFSVSEGTHHVVMNRRKPRKPDQQIVSTEPGAGCHERGLSSRWPVGGEVFFLTAALDEIVNRQQQQTI